MPIIQYFAKLEKVRKVNTNRKIEDIYNDLEKIVEPLTKVSVGVQL